ncbi:MAG: type IV toxin-antitoxin system AbiEi family antitoxin domain-containing protein [Verrucomicrobiales bacterium]|nr:type IV toxin-antitoxin system AbiEi family antitoxin domain-containing protein [Verrucomicrobiales bacterium]MCP5558052.1 type IV toxin-antitoxin system AbiEi family antitoxin domain-containing protein [Verrucomicrobiaceae bacterium]
MKKTPSDASVNQHILRRVAKKGRGWAFTPHDFADLGDPRSVGVALTRLVRDGKIRRVARGLYDSPHSHPVLGQTGATADAVIAAVARGRHLRLLPSPQVAANQLGLTTQVPAQMIYQTDGAPSTVLLGKRQIVFRRNTGRNLALAGRASGLVAQALRDVGNGKVTPDTIQHLRQRLDAAAKKQLIADMTLVPAWMRPIFLKITRDDG